MMYLTSKSKLIGLHRVFLTEKSTVLTKVKRFKLEETYMFFPITSRTEFSGSMLCVYMDPS